MDGRIDECMRAKVKNMELRKGFQLESAKVKMGVLKVKERDMGALIGQGLERDIIQGEGREAGSKG